jgi:ribosomal protein S7
VDAEGAKLLNKLVGCLNKEGKRAKAHRIVVDAMAIINDKLARQRAAAVAAAAPPGQ